MLPQLVSRDTNPWELLYGGCLPIIPVATARRLSLSPRNSLSTTRNVRQSSTSSPRPLLIHNLQSDASLGILVALRAKTGWEIHQWVQEGKTSLESFYFKNILPTMHLYVPLTLVKQVICDISFTSLDKDRRTYKQSVSFWGRCVCLRECRV